METLNQKSDARVDASESTPMPVAGDGEKVSSTPKLTVLYEKLRGKTFILDKPQFSVGRRDSMDICIKDPSMSGHHCDLIRQESGNYLIRDNDSTNGTRVNNVPVTEHELKNSDIIQLGGVEVLYDNASDDDGSSLGSDFGRTHTINLDTLDSELSTVEMSNYSPFAEVETKLQARTHKFMLLGLVLLSLGLIAIVILLLVKLFSVS